MARHRRAVDCSLHAWRRHRPPGSHGS
jgi:hypothetical protein